MVTVNNFTELDVYQRSYKNAIIVLSRCTKAIPALIAEGHAKRHQQKNFQKYLDDALGESNESIVHISITRDLGFPKPELCRSLINDYTIICKELYNLGKSWNELKVRQKNTNH